MNLFAQRHHSNWTTLRFAARLTAFIFLILASTSILRADLQSDVNAVLEDKLLKRASVGIEVYRLGSTPAELKEILGLRPEIPLTPASNLKVATTSAALDRLGPGFRFQTLMVMHGNDVILIGDGDPTFGDAEFLKKAGWGVTTVFQNWAAQLKKMGITSVNDVIVDDSVFDEEFAHPRWPGDARKPQYTARFEAEVAGINLNANCVDFLVQPTTAHSLTTFSIDPPTAYVTVTNSCVTGTANGVRLDRARGSNQIALGGEAPARGVSAVSITIHDPPMFAGTVFSETLAAGGIKMTGAVKRDRTMRRQRETAGAAGQKQWQVLAIHETPIDAVLGRCNKDSMNVYAESLCKRLGFEVTQASGSWESGTAEVGRFLKKTGVSDGEFKLDDGSGLSRGNAISPHALAKVLVYDFYAKSHVVFFDSLSIAGVDGTLDDRFHEAGMRDLRKRVFGKSGFIEGVSTLSGYLKARNDQWYVFSIMINGIPHGSNSEVKVLQERIVKAVDSGAGK